MTTASDIVTQAYRETNLIPVGDVPSADQEAEGLFLLQNIVSSVLGNEAGQRLKSVSVGLNNVPNPNRTVLELVKPYFSTANTRFTLNLTQPVTFTLPATPEDGARFGILDASGNLSSFPATIQGNGRLIEGSSTIVLNTDSLSREWFYRDDLGTWMRVVPLIGTDQFPFPEEFNDLFIGYLALRLNPRAGAQTQDETAEAIKRSLRQFKARYSQTEEAHSELALLLMPSRKYWMYNHSDKFYTGLISYTF